MKNKKSEIKHSIAPIVMGVIAVLIVFAYGFFLVCKSWPIDSYAIEKAGLFGDSFGVITSLFSALAFFGVLYANAIQREAYALQRIEYENQKLEMQDNKREINKQGFENTFFQMLKLHNQILSDMSSSRAGVGGNIITQDGRMQITALKKSLWKTFRDDSIDSLSSKDEIITNFQEFYEKYGEQLGHYFRFLYNILRFLSESGIDNKNLYSRLLRAQLSNQELSLIYYNSLTPYGANFQKYMQEFKLMDNLDPKDLYCSEHSLFIEDVGFRPLNLPKKN